MQCVTDIKHLSQNELGLLGVEQVAYVKPVFVEGVAAFAVHEADGSRIAIILDRAAALALIRTHRLEAVSVH